MDLKPCPFCGGKAKQVDICATDFSSANAGGSYIICQSCLACSAVMFGEKAGLSELWNRRALPPEPRTCETCQAKCPYPYAEPGCPFHVARSPQSADVETVREDIIKIVREVIIMWDHGGCGPLHPYSIPGQRLRELIYALDRSVATATSSSTVETFARFEKRSPGTTDVDDYEGSEHG